MDTNLLIPLLILTVMLLILWRVKVSGENKNHANSLLKVRKKRKGNIYANVKAPVLPTNTLLTTEPSEQEEYVVPELPEEFAALELIEYSDDVKTADILKDFKSLRKPHPLLMSLSRSITDSQELIRIVKSDPELVAKVLNMANSAFFGLRKSITDVNHAVIYLGISQVKNIATQFALTQSFEFESNKQKQAYNRLWKTSFFASALALFIGQEARLENASELSTRCLLNFLGDITLLSLHEDISELYDNDVPLYKRIIDIQEQYSTNAAIMAGIFGQHLDLPKDLSDSIGRSYQPMFGNWSTLEINEEEKQNILFCYGICRIAEYFIMEEDSTFSASPSFNYESAHKPELYHLQSQLEKAGLAHLSSLLQSPRIKVKLSQMQNDLHRSV